LIRTGTDLAADVFTFRRVSAYHAALEIIEKLAFAVPIKAEYDAREARFLIKSPWYGYDTKAFLQTLGSSKDSEK
jgi:hypothetical protein